MPDTREAITVVISHDAVMRDLLTVVIKSSGYTVTALTEVKGVAATAVLNSCETVFFDTRWLEDGLPEALREALSSHPELKLVIITRKADNGRTAALQQEAAAVLQTPLSTADVTNLLVQLDEERSE